MSGRTRFKCYSGDLGVTAEAHLREIKVTDRLCDLDQGTCPPLGLHFLSYVMAEAGAQGLLQVPSWADPASDQKLSNQKLPRRLSLRQKAAVPTGISKLLNQHNQVLASSLTS